MAASPRQFRLPEGGSPEEVSRLLAGSFRVRDSEETRVGRVYLDTFDWRLYADGGVLSVEPAPDGEPMRRVRWAGLDGVSRAEVYTKDQPRRAADFADGAAGEIGQIIAPRALLPVAEVDCALQVTPVVDGENKIVARVAVEEARIDGRRLPTRVVVAPLRGYRDEAEAIARALASAGFPPAEGHQLVEALTAIGKQPLDYQPKAPVAMQAGDVADEVMARALGQMLEVVLKNEPGVRDSIDPEFLHDFRVAIRRARSLIQGVRGVLPEEDAVFLNDELRWLGQVSGDVRDLDVYLMAVPRYRGELPPSMQGDLAPLSDYLHLRHGEAQAALVAALDSERYRTLLDRWQALASYRPRPSEPRRRIGEVAGHQIRRVHKRLLKDGRAITPSSPAQALHDLRRTAKKLRYLLETFRVAYPEEPIDRLVSELKKLQGMLGLHQDYEVQAHKLTAYGKAMLNEGYGGADTLMAMGVLVGQLEERQHAVRKKLGARFTRFDRKRNRKLAKQLFGTPKGRGKEKP